MATAPKLPSSIKVGHRKTAVEMTSADVMDDKDGDYNQSKARIRIRDDLVPHELAETLLHELLHACWPTTPIAGDIEEIVVTTLAEHLCQAMVDNPGLFPWIEDRLR